MPCLGAYALGGLEPPTLWLRWQKYAQLHHSAPPDISTWSNVGSPLHLHVCINYHHLWCIISLFQPFPAYCYPAGIPTCGHQPQRQAEAVSRGGGRGRSRNHVNRIPQPVQLTHGGVLAPERCWFLSGTNGRSVRTTQMAKYIEQLIHVVIFAVVLFSQISWVQSSRNFPLEYMAIYSNENITKSWN